MYYRFGAYSLDTQRYELRHTGGPIPLRRKAFQVLAYLLAHADRVVAKQELCEQVWPQQFISDAALESTIKAARQAIGDSGRGQRLIRTVYGQGYRLVAAVTTVDSAPPVRAIRPAAGHQEPPRGAPPVVGREPALAQLAHWFARAQGGERHLVFVTGEPGIGKTTLVDALLDRLAGEASLWIGCGQCVEQFGAGEAYRPVLEALGRLGRGPRGQEVVALLAQQAPTWLVQLPGLVGPADLEILQRRIAEATRERMLRELAEALEVLTAQQPLVLVLEDLHWSDPSTLDLLAVLARRREPARLLLLGTYRPPAGRRQAHPLAAVTHELHLHGHCVELPVTLLVEDAIAAYLTRRLPGLPRVDALARLVHQYTEGNPLFMVTLVDAWLAAGVLREQDGAWGLQGGVEALHDRVPDSLRQMIEGQLDRLSAEEQRVLEAASVAGGEFSAAAVAAGLAQAVEPVDDACAALARRGQWLWAVGEQSWPDGTVAGGYRFGHALYQQVLYRRVAAARRVQLHQRIGAREEVGYGVEAGTQAAELAVHFARGRDYARAVQYLRQAGENALQRYSNREAVPYFEQALVALGHLPASRDTQERAIDLRLALCSALHPLGHSERILTCLHEAEALAAALADPHRLGRISVSLSTYFRRMGVYDQAIAAAQRTLALATASGEVVLHALANQQLGETYEAQDDYRRAIDCYRQTIAYFDEAQRRECFGQGLLPAALSYAFLASCYSALGIFPEGKALGDEGLRIAETVDHPRSLMWACWGIGLLALHQGDLRRALPRLEQAMRICKDADLPAWFPRIAATLGAAYTLGGRVADAIPLLTQAMEQAMAVESPRARASRSLPLGEAYLLAGHVEEAHALAERALALFCVHQRRGHQANALRLLGEIAARRDPPDAASAEAHYRQALALAEALGMRPLQAHCHRGLGTLYAKTGQQEQSRAALSAAIALYRAMDMTFWLPQIETALVQVRAC